MSTWGGESAEGFVGISPPGSAEDDFGAHFGGVGGSVAIVLATGNGHCG